MSMATNLTMDNKEFTAMSTNEHVSPKRKKGVDYDWKQTNTEIDIIFNLDALGIEVDEAHKIDVTFSNDDVTVNFPDGQKWCCEFDHAVDGKSCKVFIRKHKFVLRAKKKEAIVWQRLETVSNPSRSSASGIDLDSPSPTSPEREDFMTLSDESLTSPSFDSLTPIASTASTCINVNSIEDIREGKETKVHNDSEKEEEPLYQLDHVKHDYIEKDNVFIVHVYVKEIRKDTVKVMFGEKSLSVQFQTMDQKFLQLHQDANDETTFSWKVNLKHEIVPSDSKFRVTGVLIEVTLNKSVAQKWGALEATLRKETTASTKSDKWISTSKASSPQNTPSTAPIAGQSAEPKRKTVAFDELADVNVSRKQDIDQENRASAEMPMGATGVSKESYPQKPTCKVSPMNKNSMEQVVTPGFTGLDNLGNTCFMNSVLQSLSNTRELRDFFLDTRFQKDINQDNPLGTGGKLAVSYAVLLKILWSGKYNSYAPSKLKNLIAMKASQFTGFAQHDAQEFMAFLLDGLHEDLNRVRNKPYTKTVDSDGRPDYVVADEAWQVYKKRNDSFIVDLFQGQYKSKLTCPVCGKISITFDPFLYLSVPLPKKKRLLPVVFFWKDPYKKPVKLVLQLPKECTTETLKDAAAKKTGVKPSAMRVLEAYRGKIYKIYGRGADLSSVQSTDTIIISEVLTEDIAKETVHEIYVIQRTLIPNQVPSHCAACRQPCLDGRKLKRCTRCYKVGYCDQNCQKHHWTAHKQHCKPTPEPVGNPFILSIPESRATFSRICSLMEAYARYSVHVFQPPVKNDNKNQLGGSSDLGSNGSQSSGSMSSLDSQSSCSSSCTITAEQDHAEENVNFTIGDSAGTSSEDDSGPNSSPTGEYSQSSHSMTAQVGSSRESSSISLDAQLPSSSSTYSATNKPPCISDSDSQQPGGDSPDNNDFGNRNLPEYSSFKMPDIDNTDSPGHENPEVENDPDNSPCSSSKSTGKSVPTIPVLGIQSSDTERSVQMFFIKPVSQDGTELRGPEGERLEDKGEEPLDLSYRQFLSIDWRNNEKMEQYVLVQTKDMDCDEDPSLQSVSRDDNGNITLQQCLDLFTEPEVLNPEEAWYCPKCKEHREATKQMSIWRLPHTLIIQLKRFSFRNFIWRDKIDKMVDYPTRCFDLSPYVQNNSKDSSVYDLYAVVNHYGGILGGHYTAFVRCADLIDTRKSDVEWRLCDDHRVTKVGGEKNVVSKGAYLLFYRRREVFSPPKSITDSQSEDSDVEEDTSDVNNSSRDRKCDIPDMKSSTKECFTEEKESSYEKDVDNYDEVDDNDIRNANLGSDLRDSTSPQTLPIHVDHLYQRQSGRVDNKQDASGSDAENDTNSGNTDEPSYPTGDLAYTDMETVD